jgi:hypothetical protein
MGVDGEQCLVCVCVCVCVCLCVCVLCVVCVCVVCVCLFVLDIMCKHGYAGMERKPLTFLCAESTCCSQTTCR